MRLDRFTLRAQEAIQTAIELAEKNQNQQVEPEHLLATMLEQPEGIVRPILGKLSVNVTVVSNDVQAAIARFPRVQGGQQYFSPRLNQVFTAAQKQAEAMQDDFISTEHLLLVLAEDKEGDAGKLLRQHGLKRDDLLKVIEQMRGGSRITDQNAESNYQALSKYARDLTDLARKGKLDPVIGRDDEIRRTIQVLSRRTKNNPVLDWRARRRQDRNRRGSGPTHRFRRRARDLCGTSDWSVLIWDPCWPERSIAASLKIG